MNEKREVNYIEKADSSQAQQPCRTAWPVCGGKLIEIRVKLQYSCCHTICETCCEGGRGKRNLADCGLFKQSFHVFHEFADGRIRTFESPPRIDCHMLDPIRDRLGLNTAHSIQ